MGNNSYNCYLWIKHKHWKNISYDFLEMYLCAFDCLLFHQNNSASYNIVYRFLKKIRPNVANRLVGLIFA